MLYQSGSSERRGFNRQEFKDSIDALGTVIHQDDVAGALEAMGKQLSYSGGQTIRFP